MDTVVDWWGACGAFGESGFSPISRPPLCTVVQMLCTLVHMGYLLLAGAIAAEVGATTAMKYSDGFSRLGSAANGTPPQ